MGKWATYRLRGTGRPLPALCPAVEAPGLLQLDIADGLIEYQFSVPAGVPAGWFMNVSQGAGSPDHGAVINSVLASAGPIGGTAEPSDGTFLSCWASSLVLGDGCQSQFNEQISP